MFAAPASRLPVLDVDGCCLGQVFVYSSLAADQRLAIAEHVPSAAVHQTGDRVSVFIPTPPFDLPDRF